MTVQPLRAFVVAYDVSSDRRRRIVARMLEDLGARVNYSVFEVWASDDEMAALVVALRRLVSDDEDHLRIYAVPPRSLEQVVRIGRALPEVSGVAIV